MNEDLLHKALIVAAKELEHNYGWCFGLNGVDSDYSKLDPEFLEVFHRHIHPLLDMPKVNKHRIIQLRARRAALDVELTELGAQTLEGVEL